MAAVIALRRAGLLMTTVATGPVTSTVNSASDTSTPSRVTVSDAADLVAGTARRCGDHSEGDRPVPAQARTGNRRLG